MRVVVRVIRVLTFLAMLPGVVAALETWNDRRILIWNDVNFTAAAAVLLLRIVGPYVVGNALANIFMPLPGPAPAPVVIERPATGPMPVIDLPV